MTESELPTIFSILRPPYLGPQLLGPHVNDASDEGLNDAELGVDADGDEHEEEHHCPHRATW